MAPHTELACIHLCSGYGGFELGFKLAGIGARTVAHVERDTYAAATLVARMAEKTLDQAPIWDDLTTFDGAAWRGKVDCITAGFPCQPFSAAGKQLGVEDDRWLWPAIKRIILGVGPRFVFLENVPQLVRGGLPFVLSDLAQLGFNAEWGLYSAAEVGAPHKRDRFWLLAHAPSFNEREPDNEERSESWCDTRGDTGGNGEQLGDTTGGQPAKGIGSGYGGTNPQRAICRPGIGPAMADTDSPRRESDRPERPRAEHDTATGASSELGHSGSEGRPKEHRSIREYAGTVRPTEGPSNVANGSGQDVADTASGGRTKDRGDVSGNSETAGRGRPSGDASWGDTYSQWPPTRDGDWVGYISEGGPQPSVRRSTDGPPVGLADTLHLGGNGLVPAVAGAAFVELLNRHNR